MGNKNEREGTDQAKGKVMPAVGTLIHNDDLKAEGLVDLTQGKVEAAVGRASRQTGDAIAPAGTLVKR